MGAWLLRSMMRLYRGMMKMMVVELYEHTQTACCIFQLNLVWLNKLYLYKTGVLKIKLCMYACVCVVREQVCLWRTHMASGEKPHLWVHTFHWVWERSVMKGSQSKNSRRKEHGSKNWSRNHRGILLTGLLFRPIISYLSYTFHDHLPRDGTNPNRLCSPTSVTNQENGFMSLLTSQS